MGVDKQFLDDWVWRSSNGGIDRHERDMLVRATIESLEAEILLLKKEVANLNKAAKSTASAMDITLTPEHISPPDEGNTVIWRKSIDGTELASGEWVIKVSGVRRYDMWRFTDESNRKLIGRDMPLWATKTIAEHTNIGPLPVTNTPIGEFVTLDGGTE